MRPQVKMLRSYRSVPWSFALWTHAHAYWLRTQPEKKTTSFSKVEQYATGGWKWICNTGALLLLLGVTSIWIHYITLYCITVHYIIITGYSPL
jgi:hypothetical protein